MGDLRASLYDIFGYFIPGLFATLGLWLLMVSVMGEPVLITTALLQGPVALGIAAVVIYTVGHLVQAIGNSIPKLDGVDPGIAVTVPIGDGNSKRHGAVLSAATIRLVEEKLRLEFGPSALEMPGRDRFSLIDEGRVRLGRDGDREVYIYHHGFYRGMVIASGLVFVGLVARTIAGPACINARDISACMGRLGFGASVICSLGAALGFWVRLCRFAKYRVTRAVFLWLQAPLVKR
jgi:hypothetical protein